MSIKPISAAVSKRPTQAAKALQRTSLAFQRLWRDCERKANAELRARLGDGYDIATHDWELNDTVDVFGYRITIKDVTQMLHERLMRRHRLSAQLRADNAIRMTNAGHRNFLARTGPSFVEMVCRSRSGWMGVCDG
eukprot:SAG11_NODE_1010_length_6199_cov_2.572131_10_plen_136_part_00